MCPKLIPCLRFLLFKNDHPRHDHSPIGSTLRLLCLASHRIETVNSFIYSLLGDFLNSLDLLFFISFCVPPTTPEITSFSNSPPSFYIWKKSPHSSHHRMLGRLSRFCFCFLPTYIVSKYL